MGDGGSKLGAALLKLAGMVGWLVKDGRNDHHGYPYVSEANVKATLRKPMAECGLVLAGVHVQASDNSTPTAAVVHVELRVALADDLSAGVVFQGVGGDQDKSGKAVMKATAAAIKYALTTMVLAPTGDDPEADVEADRMGAEQPRKARGSRKAAAADPESPENW